MQNFPWGAHSCYQRCRYVHWMSILDENHKIWNSRYSLFTHLFIPSCQKISLFASPRILIFKISVVFGLGIISNEKFKNISFLIICSTLIKNNLGKHKGTRFFHTHKKVQECFGNRMFDGILMYLNLNFQNMAIENLK